MDTQSLSVPRYAFTMAEAAASLTLSRRTLEGLVGEGKLQTVRIGRRRLVPARELERLVHPQEYVA